MVSVAPRPWQSVARGAPAGRIPVVNRSFFLDGEPREGRAALLEEDCVHARRVLRLKRGDPLTGLDGSGGRWPLVVGDTSGGRFEVRPTGQPEVDPAPGTAGAPLPWFELAVPLPKEKRAEVMLDRLTQLGLGSLVPLTAERTQGPLRKLSDGRRRRLERVAREACKQSGRTWLPRLGEPRSVEGWLRDRSEAPVAVLDPRATAKLIAWAAELPSGAGRPDRPICLLVGPEGGFTAEELALAERGGARSVRLAPHILRIETAAEAALAGLVQALGA